jgi:hypothetical protein
VTPARGEVIAHDMSGDGVAARDWVYDGTHVWEVVGVVAPGRLACRDPRWLSTEEGLVVLLADVVAKVRADRSDDSRYLRAVYEQARILQRFWADAE